MLIYQYNNVKNKKMRQKNFQEWHLIKKLLENKEEKVYFHEREIWWCSFGVNIGFEEDGKNKQFERPALVLKKFNNDLLWVLPLTSVQKVGKYYFKINFRKRNSAVILSQLRIISGKRLLSKMHMIAKNDFEEIKKRVKGFL